MSVGGSGDGTHAASSTATTEGASSEANAEDPSEGFTFRRWLGIAMLGAGLLAIAFVFWGGRRAKKAAEDASTVSGP
jgi:hypothetical protein